VGPTSRSHGTDEHLGSCLISGGNTKICSIKGFPGVFLQPSSSQSSTQVKPHGREKQRDRAKHHGGSRNIQVPGRFPTLSRCADQHHMGQTQRAAGGTPSPEGRNTKVKRERAAAKESAVHSEITWLPVSDSPGASWKPRCVPKAPGALPPTRHRRLSVPRWWLRPQNRATSGAHGTSARTGWYPQQPPQKTPIPQAGRIIKNLKLGFGAGFGFFFFGF